jgi:hypothetical protein
VFSDVEAIEPRGVVIVNERAGVGLLAGTGCRRQAPAMGGQRRGKPEPLAHHNRREWRFTWESSVERAVRSTLWQSRLGLNSAGPLKESIGLPANLRVSQEFRKDRCVRSVSQTKCLRRGYAGVGDYELL